jgi:ELWxxDGT repeat protein
VVSEEVEEGRILFAYFFTRGPEGGALWRTDGTAVGTRRITALRHDDEPAFAADAAGRNVVWDGTFYFAAATVSTGEELWVSDGTVDGTRLLTDIRPGPRGAGIRDLTVVAARGRSALLFAADDGVHGHELWTVQGGQPRLVQDIEAGPGSSSPSDFVVAGTRVYFAAWDHEHGRELWSLPFAHLIRPPGSDPGSDPEGILPVRRPR